tara:strand:+ start:54 stop:356 length:303 start_codon:yes stop_codon:yes gene_type:complete
MGTGYQKALEELGYAIDSKKKELYLNNFKLNDNELDQLLPIIFSTIPDLEILDLSHNKLTFVPPTIDRFKGLKSLFFNNNEIKQHVPEIGGLQKLSYLKI